MRKEEQGPVRPALGHKGVVKVVVRLPRGRAAPRRQRAAATGGSRRKRGGAAEVGDGGGEGQAGDDVEDDGLGGGAGLTQAGGCRTSWSAGTGEKFMMPVPGVLAGPEWDERGGGEGERKSKFFSSDWRHWRCQAHSGIRKGTGGEVAVDRTMGEPRRRDEVIAGKGLTRLGEMRAWVVGAGHGGLPALGTRSSVSSNKQGQRASGFQAKRRRSSNGNRPPVDISSKKMVCRKGKESKKKGHGRKNEQVGVDAQRGEMWG